MEEKIVSGKEVLEGSFDTAIQRLGESFSAKGYSHRVSQDYIRVVKHFCYWHGQHEHPKEISESTIKEFINHFPFCTCPVSGKGGYRLCHAALKHFLTVLRKMGLASAAFRKVLPEDEVLQSFQKHLIQVRGITEASAALYARHLKLFLQDIQVGGKFAFHALTARNVESSVIAIAGRYKPETVKLYCSSLRAFFKFLRLTGKIETPLENAVPTVPNWSLSSIPKYLTEKQVKVFLHSFDINTTVGLRNCSIALLMATAGLRSGEVANLKLDDIDWENSSLKIQNTKSYRVDYLPLVLEAGEALAAYLKRKPKTPTRHIFVTLATPVGRPLTASAVSIAMRRAFKRCYPNERTRGPHVLRHTLATMMLTNGATFKEIADVLRHRNIETTAIYAKVDIKGLNHVTLAWPEVTI